MQFKTIAQALAALITLLVIQVGGTMAKPYETEKINIPPVDRNVPAQIETATFALG